MKEPKPEKPSVDFLSPGNEKKLLTPSDAIKPGKNKPWLLYFFIGLFAFMLILLGARTLMIPPQSDPDTYGMLSPKKIGFFQTVKNFLFSQDNPVIGEENDRINILLLGIGGPGHEGPYLSDTNIILSVKPSTKEVAMISIPRDLSVKIENYGVYRVNYADALGESKNPGEGGEYARKIFSQTFSLDIPYYVRVNFDAFEQLINAVGGVDVNVTKPFVDYSFPGPNYSYQTVSFTSGTEHMEGERALQYARSRHGTNGENSDFARSRRQQQIISALKDKVFSFGTITNPATLQKIWSSLSSNIATNLEFSQMLYLASLAKNIDTENIKNLVLDSGPNGYLYSFIAPSGAFMLAPKGGGFNAINLAIINIFEPSFVPSVPVETALAISEKNTISTASSTVSGTAQSARIPTSSEFTNSDQRLDFASEAKIEIQNGTWRAGLASRLQSRLSDQGFNIITIGNSIKRPIATTTMYLINQSISNEIVNYLTKQVRGKLEMNLPDWLHDDFDDSKTIENEMGAKFNPETDILIILGADSTE